MWDKYIASAFTSKTETTSPAVIIKRKPKVNSIAQTRSFSIFPKKIAIAISNPQTTHSPLTFAPIDNQDTVTITTASIVSRPPTPGARVSTGGFFQNNTPPNRPSPPIAKELQKLANAQSNSILQVEDLEHTGTSYTG